MGKYDTAKVRNFGVIAHGGAGKTSLVEAVLFNSGVTDRLGRVDDGSSWMNFEPEEIKRNISISASVAHCQWREHQLRILDTPGYANFLHETRNALRAVDGAVLLVSALSGVKPQTQKIMDWCREFGVRTIAFVNKMDRERADFDKAMSSMSENLGLPAVAVTLPIGAEDNFRGIVDLVTMKAHLFRDDGSGGSDIGEIPADLQDEAETRRFMLMEAVAETLDELMEKYLEEETLSEEELLQGLRAGTLAGSFMPVLAGSAVKNAGVSELSDYVNWCLPAPVDCPSQAGNNPKTEELEERLPSEDAPFSALVFKTISDPYTGQLTLLRIYSGSVKTDSNFYNANKEAVERVGQLFMLNGKHQRPVAEAGPGDIVAVAKLKETATGDTLCDGSRPIVYDFPEPVRPVISFALEAASKNDEDKINAALHKLVEEDPALTVRRDEETKQLILSGMGQIHVEVTIEKLKRKFNVEVLLKAPKVPYRETLKGKAQLQSKYKKQSGGRGQYADVWLEIEPLPRGAGFEFVDKIVGGAIPRQYIPAVEKGILEASEKGVLAGYPTVDFKATLYDGSFHTVDSSEMAFKIAGSMGFKKGAEMASPVLLEPIVQMEITVPDDCVGDVIGDMNSRRGRVLGMEPKIGNQVVSAQVPLSEVLKYAPELRSMTSDRGMFTMEFSHYQEVPPQNMQKLLEELKPQD